MEEHKILNRIKEIRDINNINLKELAISSGLNESTISRIEKGLRVPSHITMLQICKGLNMNFGDVFEIDWKNVKLM